MQKYVLTYISTSVLIELNKCDKNGRENCVSKTMLLFCFFIVYIYIVGILITTVYMYNFL